MGTGVEVGGCYASAFSDDAVSLNLRVVGGSLWAECTAFGVATEAGLEPEPHRSGDRPETHT